MVCQEFIPFEAFPGSIGVLPGLPEVQAWKAREADLAAAGGVVLGPSTEELFQLLFVVKEAVMQRIV